MIGKLARMAGESEYDGPVDREHERINPLIDHLARAARGGADAALRSLGMRLRHVVALTLLRDYGTATQRSLADALRLDPSNVVALLNELESAGLVQRRRDAQDRRRHVVELTDAGLERLDEADAALVCVEDDMFGALDADERSTLYALLFKATGGRVRECREAAREEAISAGGQAVNGLDQGRDEAH
jgi:DNA-binding MarR family transcriptional regulator